MSPEFLHGLINYLSQCAHTYVDENYCPDDGPSDGSDTGPSLEQMTHIVAATSAHLSGTTMDQVDMGIAQAQAQIAFDSFPDGPPDAGQIEVLIRDAAVAFGMSQEDIDALDAAGTFSQTAQEVWAFMGGQQPPQPWMNIPEGSY